MFEDKTNYPDALQSQQPGASEAWQQDPAGQWQQPETERWQPNAPAEYQPAHSAWQQAGTQPEQPQLELPLHWRQPAPAQPDLAQPGLAQPGLAPRDLAQPSLGQPEAPAQWQPPATTQQGAQPDATPFNATSQPVIPSVPSAPSAPNPNGTFTSKAAGGNQAAKQSNKTTVIAIAAGVVAALLLVLAGIGLMGNLTKQDAATPETTTVTRGNLVETVHASGVLKAGYQVAVTPETTGTVQDVMVTEGQAVVEGDTLFTLRDTGAEKAAADAEAALARAQQALDGANAAAANAQQAYQKAQDDYNAAAASATEANEAVQAVAEQAFYDTYNAFVNAIPATTTGPEREKLITQARMEASNAYNAEISGKYIEIPAFDASQYLAAIDAANTSAAHAQEVFDSAQREHSSALQQTSKRIVKAPGAGIILDLKAEPGMAVGDAANSTSTEANTALAYVADLSTISVDAEVSEADSANVEPGQNVDVHFTAISDLTLSGTIKSVASVPTSSNDGGAEASASGSATYTVTATIYKPDNRLKPGMTASVEIVTKNIPDTLIVPVSALVEKDGKSYVKLASSEKTREGEWRDVIVEEWGNSEVAIKEGVREGDTVTLNPKGSPPNN